MRSLTLLFCACFCSLAFADDKMEQAVSAYEQGALDQAQSQFESLQRDNPDNADTWYYLGLIEHSRSQFMDAAENFEEAIERDQQQSRYYQALGEAYGSAIQNLSFFKQMRMSGKIRDAFEMAVELDPDNIDARSGLITYYLNAPKVAGGGDDKALEQAREISKRNTYRGHLAMAAVYQSQEDDAAVEREYQAAIEDSPDEIDTYLALGIFLTARERFDEAMQVYETALEKEPGNMGISYQVGRTASISGKYLDRGVEAFNGYLQHTPTPDEPGLDWANYRLGLIYQHQGDSGQARQHFEQAVALNPDHKEAKKALKKVKG